MKLVRLFLQNFTNYETLDWSPTGNLSILVGDNAQGKTNLLDGIGYLSRARSLRHPRDRELVRWGQSFFRVKGLVEAAGCPPELLITYQGGQKSLWAGRGRVERLEEYAGLFSTVYFSPEDLELVKGGPEARRQYLDGELVQVDARYARELTRYRRVLQQRNHALKKIRLARMSPDILSPYDAQLVSGGWYLAVTRAGMLEKLRPLARLIHRGMTGGNEELTMEYRGIPAGTPQEYAGALREARAADIAGGATSIGPHRDDVQLRINGRDPRIVASQGQQRTVALSLKLAEVEFLKGHKGSTPVLLLDDVFSELDAVRRRQLLSRIGEAGQTVLTCTDLDSLDPVLLGAASVYRVQAGTLQQIRP